MGLNRFKRNLIIILIVLLMASGLSLILYPFITNFIVSMRQTEILSEWEEKTETVEEVIETTEEQEKETEDDEALDEEEALIEWSEEISEKSVKDKKLEVSDYFPLKIIIPAIELEWVVNEGTDRETLKDGPGHIIGTPFPGEIGRCTISGHRTTYGAPFNRVDELVEGDLIYLETIKGEFFTYVVKGQEIVRPKDVYILEGSDKKELLLTACHPKYSAAYRLIIIAELIKIYDIGYFYDE